MRYMLLGLYFWANLCIGDRATAETSPERDLSKFCLSSQDCSIKQLDGSWGFVKGKLLTTEQVLGLPEASTLKVPGTWSQAPLNPWHADWAAARDVGTYWLILRNVQARNGLALEINNVHSSYRLFWQPLNALQKNSELFRLGWNDRDPMQSIASLRKDFISLPLESEVADYILVMQLANPNIAKGGLRTAPRLGIIQEFHRQELNRIIVFSLLIGSMLIIAIYHLLIFLQRKADRSALWLAIQCLSIAAHTVAMQGMLELIFPEPSDGRVLLRTWMMYLPHIVAPITFFAFLTVHFPKVQHRWARYLFGIPTLLISGFLLAPLSFVSRLYMVAFVPTMIAFVAFILWRCLVSIRGDREFQWVVSGIVFLGFASINDALAGSSQTGGLSILPYAEVVFIMIQGGLLSKRFAKAYSIASRLSQELELEVKRQTREIRSILDTIQQGIVTVQGQQLAFGSEHSQYMDQWFKDSLAQDSFELILNQSIHLNSDQRDQVKQVLKACLGEDQIAFEFNSALLPKELSFMIHNHEKVFEMDWSPILDGNGVIVKILVCLRDVSEVRRLRDQSRQNEEELRIIEELLNIPEDRFKVFIKKMNEYLAQSRILVSSLEDDKALDSKESIRLIFMNIHTIKGTARTLHFQAIAAASHDLEQEISELKAVSSPNTMRLLREKFERVHSVIDRYQAVSNQKLGWDLEEGNLRLPKRIILECSHLLAHLNPKLFSPEVNRSILQLELALQRYCPSDLGQAIIEASRGIDSIARDLHKTPPRIEVDAPGIMLTDSGTHLIQTLFTHMIRNTMDHGLEEVEERQHAGKAAQGVIRIETHIKDRMLLIHVLDDGRGLNLAKIKARAFDQGLIDSSSSLSMQAIAELIFKSGLSTKDAVTEISGRGVGMDSVRSFIERVGGRADVHLLGSTDEPQHVPFEIILQLPQEFWWLTKITDPIQLGA